MTFSPKGTHNTYSKSEGLVLVTDNVSGRYCRSFGSGLVAGVGGAARGNFAADILLESELGFLD